MIVMPTIPLRNKNAGMVYQRVHFRDGECDKVTASAGEDAWQAGGVGGYGTAAGSVVPKARRCMEQKLPVDAGSGYPLSKLTCEIGGVNVEAWRFGLAGFVSDDMPCPPPSRPSSIRGCPQSRQRPSNANACAPKPAFRPVACSPGTAAPMRPAPRACLPAPVQADASNRYRCPWPPSASLVRLDCGFELQGRFAKNGTERHIEDVSLDVTPTCAEKLPGSIVSSNGDLSRFASSRSMSKNPLEIIIVPPKPILNFTSARRNSATYHNQDRKGSDFHGQFLSFLPALLEQGFVQQPVGFGSLQRLVLFRIVEGSEAVVITRAGVRASFD